MRCDMIRGVGREDTDRRGEHRRGPKGKGFAEQDGSEEGGRGLRENRGVS